MFACIAEIATLDILHIAYRNPKFRYCFLFVEYRFVSAINKRFKAGGIVSTSAAIAYLMNF